MRLITAVRSVAVTLAVFVALVVAACVSTVSVLVVPAAAPAGAAATTSVVRSAHVPYESCPSTDVTLTVTVPGHAFVPGQLVQYAVVLRNTSAHACTAPGAALVHGPLAMVLGPCAPVSVRITDAGGADVYPGDVALSCPAILGEPIPPHGSITALGTWDQRSADLRTQLPPGTYTLTLDGRVRVPVQLAPGPGAVRVPLPAPVPVPVPGRISPSAPSLPLSPGPTLTRSAPIAYEGCRTGQVTLSVTVPARAVPSNLPLRYTVRLDNTGRTACGPPADQVPGASRRLSVGPCGSLSAVVSDRKGVDVYPGSMAYFCPEISPIHLDPGATATATGTWTKYEDVATGDAPPQWRQAPPGSYHLTVAPMAASAPRSRTGSVSLPFSIAPPAGAYRVPGPTSTIPVPG